MSTSLSWGQVQPYGSILLPLWQNRKSFVKIKSSSLTIFGPKSTIRAQYTILTRSKSVLILFTWELHGKMRLLTIYKAAMVSKAISAVSESWPFTGTVGSWSPLTSLKVLPCPYRGETMNFRFCQTIFDYVNDSQLGQVQPHGSVLLPLWQNRKSFVKIKNSSLTIFGPKSTISAQYTILTRS